MRSNIKLALMEAVTEGLARRWSRCSMRSGWGSLLSAVVEDLTVGAVAIVKGYFDGCCCSFLSIFAAVLSDGQSRGQK